MDVLVLKLILTPLLIGAASLAGRRWGPTVSGWLVGLPFTSGPVVFFLALRHGTRFAAATAAGTLAGTISQAAFSLGYSWIAVRLTWTLALVAGCLAFAAMTAVLRYLTLPLAPLFLSVIAALLVALLLLPQRSRAAHRLASAAPPWDIPARMAVATGFVLLLTAIAPTLGPHLSGLLAPFPLYAGILTIFAHRLQGPGSAAGVLRGLLLGLFSFAGFFLALAALIDRIGIAAGFVAALATALAIQAASLWVIRRGMPAKVAAGTRPAGSHNT